MYLFDPVRVNVLGEYGGIGLAVENHLWWNKRNWGYVQFKNSDEVTAEYVKYAKELKAMVPKVSPPLSTRKPRTWRAR